MPNKQKLELTWIGKENRSKLEPRILIENPENSHHATHKHSENDIYGNKIIHGDNLLALKALEQEFGEKVKCVYIDPPFNTGEAFEYYDDGVEHSLWLSLMRDRLLLIYNLLSVDGTLFIHIDDNELAYLIVILDEIFGRKNRKFIATFKQGSATGHKSINPGCVSTTNYIIAYAKDSRKWKPNSLFTERERDKRYNQFILNPNDECNNWTFCTLFEAYSKFKNISLKETRQVIKEKPELLDEFVLKNSSSVIQLVRPDINAVSKAAKQLIMDSKEKPNEIFYLEREDHSDMYFLRGQRIIFYKNKLKNIDGRLHTGEPLTTLWDDLLSNNLHNEGFVKFPKGKKPEALIKRCFELATNPGDLVLDSFLGSGTTAAVAHKMGRRWIGIELGDHCYTHCIPRLQKVINGEDPGGITKAVDWKGGGGFRFYELGPSLIKEDKWGNPVINPEFNPSMLSEAMCKLEGFTYKPNKEIYWMQGTSTETDYIYTTTQFITAPLAEKISEDIGTDRSLLICCSAFNCKPEDYPNLTIKKIPKTVLKKCEWDHDDYSLAVENLPEAPPETDDKSDTPRKFGKDKAGQMDLFGE